MSRPSIAFVCNEYPPAPHGGIGTFTEVVSRGLLQSGYRVRVLGVYESNRVDTVSNNGGVKVYKLAPEKPDVLGIRTRRKLFRTVAKWAAAGEIDVVEVYDYQGWAAGWPKLPVPVVARTHGASTYFRAELGKRHTLQSRLTAFIEGASMRRADRWCSVSRYTAARTAELFGLPPADAIHYNFVDCPPKRRVDRSPNRIVFTGTLTHKKGIESLIQAWNVVADLRPDAQLHIYGKDPGGLGPRLKAQLDDSVRRSVHFHGHAPRAAVLEALGTARAAVFPSWAEAFAFAPLEAMAAGCPTISSTRTSGPEAIVHGRDGLLVDPAQPAEIAAATLQILNDDKLAERLGTAGRERVEQCFCIDTALEAIDRFYIETIHGFRPSRASNVAKAHTAV